MPNNFFIKPDSGFPVQTEISEADQNRAELYHFLSFLFFAPPTQEQLSFLLSTPIEEGYFSSPLIQVSQKAQKFSTYAIKQEFFTLFTSDNVKNTYPYASAYFNTGCSKISKENIRSDMKKLELRRAESCYESEDHFSLLCATMGHLVSKPISQQIGFFKKYLEPWAAIFLCNIEASSSADFYKSIAELGNTFLQFEVTTFNMVAA